MKPRLWLLPVLAGALLAACVTTRPDGSQLSGKDAASANMKLGVEYMKQGQLQLAKDKLDRAEKQDPNNYEVHWAQASLAEKISQFDEAERHYQTAMKLSPGNSEIANTYAVFLCRTQKVDKALPLFDSVIRDALYRTPWAAATNAAVCLRSDKRNADAEVYLDRALAIRRDYLDAVIQMADLQLALGKGGKSREVIDRYLALPRKSPDLLLIGVRAALAQGDRPGADNYARLLRRDYPTAQQTQVLPQLLQSAN